MRFTIINYMKIIILLFIMFSITGCATIFSGSSEDIHINSNEQNVKIIVLGGAIGPENIRTLILTHLFYR